MKLSVFLSLLDIWVFDQLFPIRLIHWLREKRTESATIADISCDSDGKVDKFIDLRDIKEALPLHEFRRTSPYYVGICLIGAYQDVLGDLHNLFGEVHEVLATVDEDGRTRIQDVLPGESCERVLSYMNYDRDELLDGIWRQLRRATERKKVKDAEAKAIAKDFEQTLTRYTYLEK